MIEQMKKRRSIDAVDLIVEQERERKRLVQAERTERDIKRRNDRKQKRGLRYE